MSGDPLTPAEVATMRPYEREQGGWWEYGHDAYGTDQVWRPTTDPADAERADDYERGEHQ